MRRFVRRLIFAAPIALAIFGVASSVHADPPAVSLIRSLVSKGRPHPLADAHGRVAVTSALPPGVDASSFGLMPVAPGYGAIRLLPSDVEAFAHDHPALALRASPPLHLLLDRSAVWTKVDVYRKATGADGTGVVVGVVDTGLDLTHPDFHDAKGKTRVRWLLHAADANGGCHPPSPSSGKKCLEDEYGCNDPNQTACVIYDNTEIDEMLSQKSIGAALHDLEGHGTHVTSIAAGNGGPSVGAAKYIGMAPNATLIIASPSPPGLGFADSDILNAARFIFDQADALGMPCVLNLSLGGDFGPHDGTSALEKGLAAMVGDDKPGHVIVAAAGNSGVLETIDGVGPFGVHTEAHVSANGVTRVPIRTPPSTKGQIYVWITMRQGNQVSVGLEGPGGKTWIGLVDPGNEAGYTDNGTTGSVINDVVDDKSSLTADTNGAVLAVDGTWPEGDQFAVLLEGEGDAELWASGQGDASGAVFDKALKQGTINVPASSPNLLAVGCSVNRVVWPSLLDPPAIKLTEFPPGTPAIEDSVCYFSSAGPTPLGLAKPEIIAPGAFVAAAMSVDADPRIVKGGIFDGAGCPDANPCFIADARHAVALGTSMSSPHVAGAVALLLQADPSLTQASATEILQAGARHPQGTTLHDTQLGVGALDLVGAQQAMAAEPLTGAAPDVTKSWFVLSSEYVRPDPTWPVWGTVELRRTDGSIASGLDGTRLAARVKGGVTSQPLTRVSHGMWRFAFAAPEGSAGTSVEVEVTYDGARIGDVRTLPVGVDDWQSEGSPVAEGGGCTCEAGRADATSRSWMAVLALSALLLRRRRSRSEVC